MLALLVQLLPSNTNKVPQQCGKQESGGDRLAIMDSVIRCVQRKRYELNSTGLALFKNKIKQR
jgi:hypothetical protein